MSSTSVNSDHTAALVALIHLCSGDEPAACYLCDKLVVLREEWCSILDFQADPAHPELTPTRAHQELTAAIQRPPRINSDYAETPGKDTIHAESSRTLEHLCGDHLGIFLNTAIFTPIFATIFTAIYCNFFRVWVRNFAPPPTHRDAVCWGEGRGGWNGREGSGRGRESGLLGTPSCPQTPLCTPPGETPRGA